MDKRRSIDAGLMEQALPIPIQLYLWRQLRPFTRAKLGKLHEASCMEMKEASTSFEKVLVQSLHNELTPSLTDILNTVPRWRLIQTALPYVLHAAGNLLHNKKDLQNIGAMETTLLYILHWFLLDAAEECAESDSEHGLSNNPFHYLYSIPTMTLFVYLFAPLYNHLKDIDFKTNLRLENGVKIWSPMSEFTHPEAPCFTAHCKPKPRTLWWRSSKLSKPQPATDVFVGSRRKNEEFHDPESSSPNHTVTMCFTEQNLSTNTKQEEENNWVSSPKDTVFPETIPEESSSTEDEHVVIFRLPSSGESEKMDGVKEVFTIFAGEASIFHVAMGRSSSSCRSTLTIEQVTSGSGLEKNEERTSTTLRLGYMDKMKDEKTDKSSQESTKSKSSQSGPCAEVLSNDTNAQNEINNRTSGVNVDVRAATFLDVAVLRCLFVAQWQEEGVFWALQFLYNR
ncbi:hypothetical protein PV327_009957 [Microctonus hyperodae]|uniref:Cation channel complex component UNC80 N-terminal domain-containing protein n=1 Tax=Microctonus hyperodae TaxID=165561 RepID=A0AA39F218_MICHY|nr:hypothetical protein PV327_009957 [Microctonus hyperodae]